MPTIPPGQAQPPPVKLHEQREVAEAFGTDAGRYDRTRPSYPNAMVERIMAASPGRTFLDVGCGTGIAARQFQAAGCTVLGLDPDARMAELARRTGLEVEVATIEAWDPAGRDFDAVIAGQAWHWVDPVAGAAKAAQALRPGGRIALFWNAGQAPADVAKSFAAVYREVMPGTPVNLWERPIIDAYMTMCDKAADGIGQTGSFGEPERWRFDWERTYTREEWLDQVPTFGGHSRLPDDRREKLLAGLGSAIDDVGGGFTMGYATVVVTAARNGVAALHRK